MLTSSYESNLKSLIRRLETALTTVDAAADAQKDRTLIQSLEDGSYGDRELDRLFSLVEEPLTAAVTRMAAGNRLYPSAEFEPPDDPFFRAVCLLESRRYSSEAESGLPLIDLLDPEADHESLGRKGAAQVGLIRRLIHRHGMESLEATIQEIADDPESFHTPQIGTAEEVARLLRLVLPIERVHDFPVLYFLSPTGQIVESSTTFAGQQCAPEYYMRVDK